MKPMLFNTEMVRAILEGRKAVTRRVVKPQPEERHIPGESGCYTYHSIPCGLDGLTNFSPYRPGDILYVRETFFEHKNHFYYKADGKHEVLAMLGITFKWRPSIHMPRKAARIFLRVTDVRVERLQNLGIEEALEEGITPTNRPGGCRCRFAFDGCMEEPCSNRTAYEIERHVEPFAQLWDSTIKKADHALYGWEANPWVWVIEFERCIQ